MTTLREAAQQALEALESLTTYDSRPSNIWRYFYPSTTGDYVNLREFKEQADPAIAALRAALAEPREHVTDGTQCWCNPETTYVDPDTGASVIVHKEPQ